MFAVFAAGSMPSHTARVKTSFQYCRFVSRKPDLCFLLRLVISSVTLFQDRRNWEPGGRLPCYCCKVLA